MEDKVQKFRHKATYRRILTQVLLLSSSRGYFVLETIGHNFLKYFFLTDKEEGLGNMPHRVTPANAPLIHKVTAQTYSKLHWDAKHTDHLMALTSTVLTVSYYSM